MNTVFATGLLLAATIAGTASAQNWQDIATTPVELSYAPDASVVTNPDADAFTTLSGVDATPTLGTSPTLRGYVLSTSG